MSRLIVASQSVGSTAILEALAKELRDRAIDADKALRTSNSVHSKLHVALANSVLIGLSIELYLKAFMLHGRKSGITREHNLSQLFSEFPAFLKTAIAHSYREFRPFDNSSIEFAIMMPGSVPPTGIMKSFEADITEFQNALKEISNMFVEARYFFEKVNKTDWALFKYYFGPAKMIATVLAVVLVDYKKGKFKGTK
jgi:hypothetical protein